MNTETTPWVIAGASAIIAALSSAVAFLFKLNESKSLAAVAGLELRVDHQSKQLDELEKMNRECLIDRSRLAAKCEIFEKRLTEIEKKTE